jgi:outer membrane protein
LGTDKNKVHSWSASFMSLARRIGAAILLTAGAGSAFAQLDERWSVKAGAHAVNPKSDSGSLAGGALATDVDSSLRPSAMLEYFVTPAIGVELLAAWPFRHEVKLNGAEAAQTKELPPTVSLQYHFLTRSAISPYVGAGLNFTRFFNVDERGPLLGADLTLGDSWGFAAHAGIDFRLTERWLAGADFRWIDIDTTARVNGAKVGTVNVDPLVWGAYVGYRF